MKSYISTESLYDSGSHLSHARQYAHKYIKREPDGKGGYRYWYKTDIVGKDVAQGTGKRVDVDRYSLSNNSRASLGASGVRSDGKRVTEYATVLPRDFSGVKKYFREHDKAGQIYQEGQSQNAKDYQSRINQASKETKPKKKTVGDYAKQTIDTISTAAGSAYDAGKKFLQSLF